MLCVSDNNLLASPIRFSFQSTGYYIEYMCVEGLKGLPTEYMERK